MHDQAACLYENFCSWQKDNSRPFRGGKIVRNGPASIAIIPEGESDKIFKIIKEGRVPFGLPVQHEYALIQKLAPYSSDLFAFPRPISWGRDPDFIVMERLGDSFGLTFPSEQETKKIGTAIGACAALLFRNFNMFHDDMALGNCTQMPDEQGLAKDSGKPQTRRVKIYAEKDL